MPGSMALYTRPTFDEVTLERLPNFHAIGRFLTHEGPLEPLVFRTLPPLLNARKGVTSAVRRQQRRYSRPIATVEEETRARRQVRGLKSA